MPPEARTPQDQPASKLTSTIAAVERAWAESGTVPPDNFLRTYFAHLDPGDAKRLGIDGLVGVAASHLAWAQENTAGVRVYNPDGRGYSSPRTVITIVNRDRPHLTASVISELTWAGYAIRMVLHPIMAVHRGARLEFLDLGDEAALEVSGGDTSSLPLVPELGDAVVESWIHVEIDRVPDEDLPTIEKALQESLGQVSAADHDAAAMRAKAIQIADELEAGAAGPALATEAAQAARLLRWLGEHFTFLGFKEYSLHSGSEGDYLEPLADSALGIMTLRPETATHRHTLTSEVERKAREKRVLVLTKANSRSRVRRHSYMDYIGVKTFDAAGEVVGERRFIGLFTTRAYTSSPTQIPLIDDKVSEITRRAGFSSRSHSGEDLAAILESYPRDELFQAPVDEIYPTVMAAVNMEERHESRVFVRRDPYLRFVSVIVYVPKELYDTASRRRVENVLRDLYQANSVDFDVYLSDSALARLHYVARVPRGVELPEVSSEQAEERIVAALRSWTEDVHTFLAPTARIVTSEELDRANRWTDAFPLSYKEFHRPAEAVEDVALLEALQREPERPLVKLRRSHGKSDEAGLLRMSFYRAAPISLSHILPMLSNLGAEVLDENPFVVEPRDAAPLYIYDFGLRFGRDLDDDDAERLREAFVALWTGVTESGALDGLVTRAGLGWRDVALIRAITRYLRQVGFAYSDRFVAETLLAHPEIAALIVGLFRVKFDPSISERGAIVEQRRAEALARLDEVVSLDADRALRAQLQVIDATVRTNFFRTDEDGSPLARIVLKIHPRELDFAPKPRPALEMWVYSPRVEGVHLRFGPVARGGLRWSDRREDFRTEVLGLVKAQMVKNALIVPTGAKGGFYAKQLPDASDREAWLAEGKAAYTEFINALLDVTDNVVSIDGARSIEYPDDVVRHDGDDTYLVVAADKGTATFSDLANSIAMGRGFWLQDAFASGGSVGYDHKAMAITSRGAWESVKRHFRELGVDVQNDDFTVVGIGDMSGDVFGNGMLRSRHIRLVAAFDHRHIFLDPTPDPESSFVERERMFALPRSSWMDYDAGLISEGGGVFPRSAKTVEVSSQAAEALGISPGPRAPQELLSEILKAPVDLLYNGGIGTYIKASSESVADVGDKANDAIRINGNEVRATVIGEGGNLGLTQLGRIEAALSGVRLNTDAVDNSAGVDCSDHEVNIKLFLATLMTDGKLDPADRDDLLLSMTDEVGDDVLANNYHQNQVLGEAREQTVPMTGTYQRLLRYLERHAELDRAVEFLPNGKELATRREAGQGFTSPELSVLLAYVKMHAADALLASSLPDEQWAQPALLKYFPQSLMADFGDSAGAHPLRREIVTAVLVNTLVDRGGLTYAYRLVEETGASVPQIVRVFASVMEIFHLEEFMIKVEQLDNVVSTETQIDLQLSFVRLLDRASRWLVHQSPEGLDVADATQRYGSVVDGLYALVPSLLRGEEEAERTENMAALVAKGVPEDVAGRAAAMLAEFSLLDVAQAAERTGEDPAAVAEVYYAVSDRFKAPKILDLIGGLDRSDRWSALARGALREDFYLEMFNIVQAVLTSTDASRGADERIDAWLEQNRTGFEQAVETLEDVLEADHNDISVVSVLLRRLRSVLRASSSQSPSREINPRVPGAAEGQGDGR